MNAAEREEYLKSGFVLLEPGFSPDILAAALADIEALLTGIRENLGDKDRRTRETVGGLIHKSPAVRAIVDSVCFAEACRGLLGQEADLRFVFSLTKSERRGAPVPWHQDWGLDRDSGHPRFSFWMALSEVDEGNACLRIVPGSHREPLHPHVAGLPDAHDLLGIDGDYRERAIPLPMRPGQVLLLHPLVIHGSEACASPRRRVALLGSFQIPKPIYEPFWADAGMTFLRRGVREWKPLQRADAG